MGRVMSLSDIQRKLKAPKGQYNDFSKFKYRSCEDILEAVKPLIHDLDGSIVIDDDMVMLGDRYYVKATVTLTVGDKSYTSSAYAREALEKKGMDASQITGSASSYARKYALNGLLAIDDTKDADTQDNTNKPKKRVNKKLVQEYVQGFVQAIADDDALCMKELSDELKDTPELMEVWGALDSKQKAFIKSALHKETKNGNNEI